MSEHDVSGACPSGTVAFVPSASSPDGLDQRLQSTGGAHTPGPWSLGLCNDGYQYIDAPFSETKWKRFARVVVEMEDGERRHDGEANARLIASAPELLSAAYLGLAFMEAAFADPDKLKTSERVMNDFATAIEQIRAAIAKAEGR